MSILKVANIHFETAGTNRIDYLGDNKVHINSGNGTVLSGSTTDALLRITQTGTGEALRVEDSSNPDSTPFVVNANGQVSINTDSVEGQLTVVRSSDGIVGRFQRAGGTNLPILDVSISDTAPLVNLIGTGLGDTSIAFTTGGAERLRIPSGGGLKVINGFGVGTDPSATAGEIRATNNITAYYSDKRLKTNIRRIENALEKLSKITGVTFQSNEEAAKYGYTDKKVQIGVIAQEVEEVLPEVVVPAPFDIAQNPDGTEYSKSGENYKTVQYEKLIPLLIEAIKDLKAEIDMLKGN